MTKRIICLLLCLLCTVPLFAACAEEGAEEDEIKGAYINMYLSDIVYDLDPAYSLNNDSVQKVTSLIFAGLFKLNENGKVENDLVEKCVIKEDDKSGEYKMSLTLKTTYWSDGVILDAADIIFAWKRILEVEHSNSAAALLFDIKNARAVVEGDCSIDDLGISDPEQNVLEIVFETKIDYEQFKLNLTSPALVPLREDIVVKNDDWAKKPATIVCSGPFILRSVDYTEGSESMVLERNAYYLRDKEKDALDEYVTPYRLVIDQSLSDEDIKAKYDNGEIFYVGEIPMSLRAGYAEDAVISDKMSTHTYFLNQNAEIGGEKLFAKAEVRKALSLAIDRQAIASAVVFAEAADGLVPNGIYDSTSKKKQFRDAVENIIAPTADITAAKSLLSGAGIDAAKYSFEISVRAEDEVHVAIAEAVKAAWTELGFKVELDLVKCIVNDDKNILTDEVAKDIRDDIFNEKFYSGDYQVIALDYVAPSPDAFSVLAPFAKAFAGREIDMNSLNYDLKPHLSGFDDAEYNALIEEAFAEKDIEKRAEKLHAAEAMLLDKMAVIPVVFNQDAYLVSGELSKVKSSYYANRVFTQTKLKNFEQYLETEAPAQ